MELPDWVVQEVGRLHLHALALERALAEAQSEQADDETPDPSDDPPRQQED